VWNENLFSLPPRCGYNEKYTNEKKKIITTLENCLRDSFLFPYISMIEIKFLILFLIREFSRRPLFKFQHAHGRITVKSIKQRLLFVLIYTFVDVADTPTSIRNNNDTIRHGHPSSVGI